MPELEAHEKRSRDILQGPFTEVHEYLDQYNNSKDHPFTAHLHRRCLHHWEGIKEVVAFFEPWAALPAIVHILDDCLGYIPSASDYTEGKVDEYGRPKDGSLIKSGWYAKFYQNK
jgi:hypothetical protein